MPPRNEIPQAPGSPGMAPGAGTREKTRGTAPRAGTRVKICGITTLADAEMCVEAGATDLGLNLIAASPRCVSVQVAHDIARRIGEMDAARRAGELDAARRIGEQDAPRRTGGRVRTVLVVADLSVAEVRELLRNTGALCAQLHGDEPPDVVAALLPRAYKAIRVGGPADLALADTYPGDDILVDAKVKGQLGGTGRLVDWDLVAPLAARRHVTLAGGLSPDNVARAIERVRPFRVDVASGVELAPGRKDGARVRAFIDAVRACDGTAS
jgi:phosphoribosylanthranilate isomerase